MPDLRFPNLDALRLALASGIVPPDTAREPVRAAESDGAIWVQAPTSLTRESSSALTRIGVTLHGPGSAPSLSDFPRWAALLPLREERMAELPEAILVEAPDASLARLMADARRRAEEPAIRLLPGSTRSWMLFRKPPPLILGLAHEPETELFYEQAPRVWVRLGFRHPLDRGLSAPEGVIALLRPQAPWKLIPDEPLTPPLDFLPVKGHPTAHTLPEPPAPLAITLQLRTGNSGTEESLWVLPGEPQTALGSLAQESDEQLLRRFRTACYHDGDRARTLLRAAPSGKGRPPVLVPGIPGKAAHPTLSNLFLPVGTRLVPTLRLPVLTKLFDLSPEVLVVLDSSENGIVPHRVAAGTLRPPLDWIEYEVPPTRRLTPVAPMMERFEPLRFVLRNDRLPAIEPVVISESETPQEAPTWVKRTLGRWADFLPRVRRASRRRRLDVVPPPPDDSAARRVEEKLASPQSLLLGNEWNARRGTLEQQVLTDLPRLRPDRRAEVWRDLAEVYDAVGNPADAAVCWINAIWDMEPPPPEWTSYWVRAELRAARLGKETTDLGAILRAAGGPTAARVAAAQLVRAAHSPVPPDDLRELLPPVAALMDRHEADLPARAVWLARTAIARWTDGDPLGLARCRDRIFRRLIEKGPGLDLDAPSFLRFEGEGRRFPSARDWLVRVRDPAHKWLGRLPPSGRFQSAGIDPETICTGAYADLLFAWGLSKLGDRARGKDLETHADAAFERAARQSSADPAVHRVLRTIFADRIAAALDGREARGGIPPEAMEQALELDELGLYAVDRFRAQSRVLEPVDLVDPYRRWNPPLIARDPSFTAALVKLAEPDRIADPGLAASVAARLAGESEAEILIPSLQVLLEAASRVDARTVTTMIPTTARALEAAVLQPDLFGTPAVSRLVTAACHAASVAHLPDSFRRFIDALVRSCSDENSQVGQAVVASSGTLFRTLRRLGIGSLSESLLPLLERHATTQSHKLGLAIGRFAAGDEEEGNRLLANARDLLFVDGIPDERERTEVSIAYAAATGHASPRIALGRLEELFQRLDTVSIRGAANRWYTLKPLELIDVVVRAVVGDDFRLGLGGRGWLDDDEFLIRKRVTRELAEVVER